MSCRAEKGRRWEEQDEGVWGWVKRELREKEGRGGVERSGMEPPGERSGASCP